MYTTREIIEAAYAEIGMGEYVYDAQPEELVDALNRLDAMLAEWGADGIVTGYTVFDSPSTADMDLASGIVQSLVRPVILNLAVELCPMFGKTPSPQTTAAARAGKSLAIRQTVAVPVMRAASTATPAGAGYKFNGGVLTLADE